MSIYNEGTQVRQEFHSNDDGVMGFFSSISLMYKCTFLLLPMGLLFYSPGFMHTGFYKIIYEAN